MSDLETALYNTIAKLTAERDALVAERDALREGVIDIACALGVGLVSTRDSKDVLERTLEDARRVYQQLDQVGAPSNLRPGDRVLWVVAKLTEATTAAWPRRPGGTL